MKKSDFAQKLLDDLRLRKQRLAAANAASISDTRDSKFQRPSQGSRVQNIHEFNARQSRSHGRHKSLVGEVSKELVPIHATQTSECFSDLSMALAFALENGGRLGKIEFTSTPMAGKKALTHHVRRQSIDFGDINLRCFSDKSKHTQVQFPHLSQFHIQEISKGAQKLNKILKACSNGINFDRYSIEVGKELLKGAVDLQESLRMLVNLQEASDYTVAPRRKQIQLLDGEDDEDEDAIAVENQLSLQKPRFSFDGSSRNYLKDVAKISIVKNKLQVLSYSETMNSRKQQNTQKQSSTISTHRRSATFDLDSRAISSFSGANKDFRSEKPMSPSNSRTISSNSSNLDTKFKSTIKQPKSLSSEQEKGRIPSVIAKLMGLEELPLEVDTKNSGVKKAAESKQGTHEISKQKAQRNVKEAHSMIRSSERPVSQINQQMKVPQANKIMLSLDTTSERVASEGKQDRKDLKNMENVNPLMKNSQKPTFAVEKKINFIHVDQIKENRTAKQEEHGRAEKVKNHREENITGRGDQKLNTTQKPVLEFDSQQKISRTHDNPEAKVVETAKRSPLLKDHKIVKEKTPVQSSQHKPLQENESKQQPSIHKSESKDVKHEGAEREKNTKIKLRIKDARGEIMPKNSLKPMRQDKVEKKLQQKNNISSVARKKFSRETINAVQPNGHENSTSSVRESADRRTEEQRPIDSKANVEKASPLNPPVVILKTARDQFIKKVDNKRVVQRSEKGRTIDEERDIKVGPLQTSSFPLKQQTPDLEELKQMRNGKTNEASETTGSVEPQIPNQHQKQKTSLHSPSLNPAADDGLKPQEREKTVPENTNNNAITSKAFASLQLPEISPSEDQQLKSNSKEIPPKALTENNRIDNCNSPEQKQQSIPKFEIQEGSLNAHENHLKQMLIKSQHFLNAAEAFFNLQIPADILHASYRTRPDKENKPVIDCAYEIMKRKGRKVELASHSPMKMSIVLLKKVKSFDDLIKELSEDLGHLNFNGKVEDGDYDAANFLDNMLKRDIHSKNLDADCMWDFGWSDPTCAFLETDEVIKDVEKHVLNRLIDEIAGDLINISMLDSLFQSSKLMKIQ